jgi:predicted transcriptional regulator
LPLFIKDLVRIILETKEHITFNGNTVSREFKVNVYSAYNEDYFATFSLEGQVIKEYRLKSSSSNYMEYLSKEENLSYVISLLEQDFGNKANIVFEIIKLVSKESIGFNELISKVGSTYGKNVPVIINKMIRLRYLTPVETESGIKVALSEKGKKILSLEGEKE